MLNDPPIRERAVVVSCEELHPDAVSFAGFGNEFSAKSVWANIDVLKVRHGTDRSWIDSATDAATPARSKESRTELVTITVKDLRPTVQVD